MGISMGLTVLVSLKYTLSTLVAHYVIASTSLCKIS